MQYYKKFLERLYLKSYEDEVLGRSAEVAFYFFFSIFPLLLFLITLFGLVLRNASDLQNQLFSSLRQVMPVSAYELVEKTLSEITEKSSGGKLTLGLLVMLWSASAGFDSLGSALNRIYRLEETRSWWKTKLISLFLTLVVSILIFVTLFVSIQGLSIVSYIFYPSISDFLSNVLILAVLILVYALIDNLCPNINRKDWRCLSVGAVFSIISWILISFGFSVYLSYFDTYARIYGSLGAVIILMIWFYLSAMMILIGAEINSVLKERKDVFDASGNN